MAKRVLIIVGVLSVMILAYVIGLFNGYMQGMYDGKTAVFNQNYREWTSIIEPTLDSLDIQNLTLDRTVDGYVIIYGELPREELAELRKALIQEFGSHSTRTALRRVVESDAPSDIDPERSN